MVSQAIKCAQVIFGQIFLKLR